jgi:hypothetical protein
MGSERTALELNGVSESERKLQSGSFWTVKRSRRFGAVLATAAASLTGFAAEALAAALVVPGGQTPAQEARC